MFVIEKKKNLMYSLPTKEIKVNNLRHIGSELSQKILELLAKQPQYPIELAKKLKVHEQKIYYHIKNLKEAGIINIVKKENKKGVIANYYALAQPSITVCFKEFQSTQKISNLSEQHRKFLEPFIKEGQLDCLIIVGSPDPHGPDKARSRDGYYGIDFALFLGTFLNYVPHFNVKLDTEVRTEDLQKNLIIIGGPIVNKITAQVNLKLPVYFDKKNHWTITSSLTGNTYPSAESGLIVKTKNPFNKEKKILVIAGKRYSGTRAAIIAFLEGFKKITAGNIHNKDIPAKVVEGIDLDSDGIIDSIEFRE